MQHQCAVEREAAENKKPVPPKNAVAFAELNRQYRKIADHGDLGKLYLKKAEPDTKGTLLEALKINSVLHD